MTSKRLLTVGAGAALLLMTGIGSAQAHDRYRDSDRDRDSPQAVSYINPDLGAATANPDVDPNSSCFSPDQYDQQAFSAPGMANNNVHNDACFLDDRGNKVDGPASFESEGVGFISACPDPDGAGPEVAVLSDTDGDGRNDLCFQSAYQEKGVAGDFEFHARLNNNGMPGTQYVTWCSDDDRNGCDDERNSSSIRIDWSADGTATFSEDDRDRDGRDYWSG